MGKVLHASYSGYFPSCIREETRERGIVEGSIENLMYIYWRVKTWKLESITGIFINQPDGFDWQFNSGNIELGSIRADTEEQLVCGKNFSPGSKVVFFTILTGEPEGSSAAGQFNVRYSPIVTKKENEEVYQMTFIQEFLVTDNVRFSNNQGQLGVQCGTMVINPIQVTVPIYGGNGGDLLIKISPVEWWSYGGTYNTETVS